MKNNEIWMKSISDLNDEREQIVLPELFDDQTWIHYSWAKEINFSPTRTYYVSSFCKQINDDEMLRDYGECQYGYKNDRIADLIGPIVMYEHPTRHPAVSQVVAFDVIYDISEARKELLYLFDVIDLFQMTEDEKHSFLQEMLQYWILSVKDEKWAKERERRYVIFLYPEYTYLEMKIEDGVLKEKTSLLILPDFILGENPVKQFLQKQIEAKQKNTRTGEYMHCRECLSQDYDFRARRYTSGLCCSVCGSTDVEIVGGD